MYILMLHICYYTRRTKCKYKQINGVPGIMSGCSRNLKKNKKTKKQTTCSDVIVELWVVFFFLDYIPRFKKKKWSVMDAHSVMMDSFKFSACILKSNEFNEFFFSSLSPLGLQIKILWSKDCVDFTRLYDIWMGDNKRNQLYCRGVEG